MAGVDPHSILSLLDEASPLALGQDMDEDAPAAGEGLQSPISEVDLAAAPSTATLMVQAPLAPNQGRSAIILGSIL